MRVTTCLICLVSLAGMAGRPGKIQAGMVSESGTDAFSAAGWGISPTPDLVSASATFDATYLYLSVRITPGFPAIDPSTQKGSTNISFLLDIDQNPATGYGGYCSGSCDVGILGWERAVNFWTDSPTFARLSNNSFSSLGTFPATYQPDGFDTKIPLASLGDDGLLTFKLLNQVYLGSGAFTTILDVLPNAGLPAGISSSVAVPESATIMLLVTLLPLAASRNSLPNRRRKKPSLQCIARNGLAK